MVVPCTVPLEVMLPDATVPNPGHGWAEIENMPDPSTICTAPCGGESGSLTIDNCRWVQLTYNLGEINVESNCAANEIVQGVKTTMGDDAGEMASVPSVNL